MPSRIRNKIRNQKLKFPKTIIDSAFVLGLIIAPAIIFASEKVGGMDRLAGAFGSQANIQNIQTVSQEPEIQGPETIIYVAPIQDIAEQTPVDPTPLPNIVVENQEPHSPIIPKKEIVTEAPTKPTDPFSSITLRAASAIVFDVEHDKVIFEKNADTSRPLASITKVVTALVAAEEAKRAEEAGIPVQLAIRAEDLAQDGDSGLLQGELWNVDKLSDLTLVVSSNDGAEALTQVAGDRGTFIQHMNELVSRLKLSSMSFFNPSGLDESTSRAGGYGSARDVATLFTHVVRSKDPILDATRYKTFSVASDTAAHDVKNTNAAIGSIPGLIASKTGYSDLAGGNLAVAFDAGIGRIVVAVVLGSTYSGRFDDMRALVDAVLRTRGESVESGI
ncbi:MAG TPA: serine hydrolase [Candidatus Paceibacterota bacterium]|nr:serine hydrolase [Candidatus Paceibacterota bacterium]